MEYLMLEILADEVKQGNKSTNQFKANLFSRVSNAINEQLGMDCSSKHVENHLKTIRNTWITIQTLNKSGLGWDDNLKIITKDNDNDLEGPSIEKDVQVTETSQIKASRKRKCSFEVQDVISDISIKFGEVATAIDRMIDSHLDVTKFYEKVMAIEGYNEEFLGDAFDYLVQSDTLAKTFMVKNQNLRKVWLERFNDDETRGGVGLKMMKTARWGGVKDDEDAAMEWGADGMDEVKVRLMGVV
ncbi:hypothetical protein FXO37_17957 [Capsicum annuum]|nr:hypothetical protein FXO37_17957 [Capsicum annuum]